MICKTLGHCRVLVWLLFAFLTGLCVPPSTSANNGEQLKPQGYVSDFAGVLDAQAEARLTALCKEVDQKARAQIAVVTIRSLEGAPLEEFSHRLATRWGVGHKGDNRGVLILLAINDRKYRIEVGYGLEPILPDGKVGGLGREMVPMLRAGDNRGALLHVTRRIAEVIAADRGVTLEGLPVAAPAPRPPPASPPQAPSPELDQSGELSTLLYFGGQYAGFVIALILLIDFCVRHDRKYSLILIAVSLFAIVLFSYWTIPEEYVTWGNYWGTFFVVSCLCFWLCGVIASGILAEKKNRLAGGWILLGVFFGSPPLLLLMWLPKRRYPPEGWLASAFGDGGSSGGGSWGGGGGFGGFGGGGFGGGGASGGW